MEHLHLAVDVFHTCRALRLSSLSPKYVPTGRPPDPEPLGLSKLLGLLLSHGLDIDVKNCWGQTALNLAAQRPHRCEGECGSLQPPETITCAQ